MSCKAVTSADGAVRMIPWLNVARSRFGPVRSVMLSTRLVGRNTTMHLGAFMDP